MSSKILRKIRRIVKNGISSGERTPSKSEKRLTKVIEATGWDRETAKEKMSNAVNEYGITRSDYVKHAFYSLPESEMAKEARKILKHKARITTITDATGWDRKTAAKNMRTDTKRFGISEKAYVANEFFALKDEDKAEAAALILEQIASDKTRNKAFRESCITSSMSAMGWSREEAVERLDAARKKYGISYKAYLRQKFYRLSPEDQEHEFKKIIERRASGRSEREEKEDQILAETGWSREQMMEEFEKIKERIHCSWKEYSQLELYKMTEVEQDNIYLRDYQDKIVRRYPRPKELTALFEDKAAANTLFKDYIRRPWCINIECDRERFIELFKDSVGVIYKPVFGLQARGVEAFRFSEHEIGEVYDTVSAYPKGVVEGLVVQHPRMMLLNPTSVNCLRVVSFSSTKKPVLADGRHADIAAVSLKMGGDGSVVDNLHAGGGVVAGVDLETGKICTDGVTWQCERYVNHPVTGVKLRGFEIPYFKEAKEMVYEMIDKLGINGIVGWDIAISENGPLLIEPNGTPDPALLDLPYAPDHLGIKDRFTKYLYKSKGRRRRSRGAGGATDAK